MVHPAETGAKAVVPTRVGVDRGPHRLRAGLESRPHTAWGWTGFNTGCNDQCVGRPHTAWGWTVFSARQAVVQRPSSPHAWGWTALIRTILERGKSRPHTRGGGPKREVLGPIPGTSSPHPRGGGPVCESHAPARSRSSPHAWGWTAVVLIVEGHALVVPTRVGVDRAHRGIEANSRGSSPHRVGVDRAGPWKRRCCGRRPHTRGGGPPTVGSPGGGVPSSPHRVGVDRLRPT